MNREKLDPNALESVPKKFYVNPDNNGDLRKIRESNHDWAVCVDLRSGQIYIGDGHEDILQRHRIPEATLCKVAAKFGPEDVNVTIFDYAFGARKRSIEPDALKDMIVAALRRDVLEKQD